MLRIIAHCDPPTHTHNDAWHVVLQQHHKPLGLCYLDRPLPAPRSRALRATCSARWSWRPSSRLRRSRSCSLSSAPPTPTAACTACVYTGRLEGGRGGGNRAWRGIPRGCQPGGHACVSAHCMHGVLSACRHAQCAHAGAIVLPCILVASCRLPLTLLAPALCTCVSTIFIAVLHGCAANISPCSPLGTWKALGRSEELPGAPQDC